MTGKVLPFCKRPRIVHTSAVVVYSVAIMSMLRNYLAWQYSQFIQLRCDRQLKSDMKLDYYYMPTRFEDLILFPFLHYDSYGGLWLAQARPARDLIQSFLDQELYVIAYLQGSSVPILIYGYDPGGEVMAVRHEGHVLHPYPARMEDLKLFRLVTLKPNHSLVRNFNPLLFAEYAEDYLMSNNSSAKDSHFTGFTDDAIYGIRVYDQLKKYYLAYPPSEAKRYLKFLLEHKKHLTGAFMYMLKNQYIRYADDCVKRYRSLVTAFRDMIRLTDQGNLTAREAGKFLDHIEREEKAILSAVLSEWRARR